MANTIGGAASPDNVTITSVSRRRSVAPVVDLWGGGGVGAQEGEGVRDVGVQAEDKGNESRVGGVGEGEGVGVKAGDGRIALSQAESRVRELGKVNGRVSDEGGLGRRADGESVNIAATAAVYQGTDAVSALLRVDALSSEVKLSFDEAGMNVTASLLSIPFISTPGDASAASPEITTTPVMAVDTTPAPVIENITTTPLPTPDPETGPESCGDGAREVGSTLPKIDICIRE